MLQTRNEGIVNAGAAGASSSPPWKQSRRPAKSNAGKKRLEAEKRPAKSNADREIDAMAQFDEIVEAVVPADAQPGGKMMILTQTGQRKKVKVPDGAEPGDTLKLHRSMTRGGPAGSGKSPRWMHRWEGMRAIMKKRAWMNAERTRLLLVTTNKEYIDAEVKRRWAAAEAAKAKAKPTA